LLTCSLSKTEGYCIRAVCFFPVCDNVAANYNHYYGNYTPLYLKAG
jgi:hypothetical protein